MASIRSFFSTLIGGSPHEEEEPPLKSAREVEAQRIHDEQKQRLRKAIDTRKKLDLQVSNITEELQR